MNEQPLSSTLRTTIISARRAYSFPADGLRLSSLSTIEVHQAIGRAFGFQAIQIGTPPPTFGVVAVTMPPGLIFNYGAAPIVDGIASPIRFLHFEPQRVVFDVAGPSAAIDASYERLKSVLDEITLADNTPIMDEPYRIHDYSELSGPAVYRSDALMMFDLRAIIEPVLRIAYPDPGLIAAPSIRLTLADPSTPFASPSLVGSPDAFLYELRSGTQVSEQVYFSGAPLPTDTHMALRGRVETFLQQRSSIT